MKDEQFINLAGKYMNTVFRVALNYVKSPDTADDITQEVFLRLYKTGTVFESEEHARNWLIRVTINECKRDFSSHWRSVTPLEEATKEAHFSTAESYDLFQIVMELPQKYRIVIYLHYYEGYTTKEIAQILKIRQSTVCTQLERGRRLLKTMLDDS